MVPPQFPSIFKFFKLQLSQFLQPLRLFRAHLLNTYEAHAHTLKQAQIFWGNIHLNVHHFWAVSRPMHFLLHGGRQFFQRWFQWFLLPSHVASRGINTMMYLHLLFQRFLLSCDGLGALPAFRKYRKRREALASSLSASTLLMVDHQRLSIWGHFARSLTTSQLQDSANMHCLKNSP